MDEIKKILADINITLTSISGELEESKTFLEIVFESGITVLLASVLTIIITNSFNKSENEKKRKFELDKLEKEFDSSIQIRREEILINKYDTIVEVFKEYRLEYHSFQNAILTAIKVGKYAQHDFNNEITKLRTIYSTFSKKHSVNLGSLKVDLSLLNLDECKQIVNSIEEKMVRVFDLVRSIKVGSNLVEIESQFLDLNTECYTYFISFMENFSNRYLKLFKLTEKK